MLLRRRAMMSSKKKEVFPDGFVPVEYLQTDGSQYIDSGFAPRIDMEFSLDIQSTKGSGTSILILSDFSWSTYEQIDIRIDETFYEMWAAGYSNTSSAKFGNGANVRHVYKIAKNGIYVDGELMVSMNPSGTFNGYTNTLKIFGNTDSYKFIGKIWNFKIEEDGSTIMDLVPGRFGNSVGCMYDKISGKIFYSNGSQPFACGPDLT